MNNLEYLLNQREIYGATTPTLRRGHGVDPTDADYNSTGKDTVLGYPIYRWTPAVQGNANLPNNWWHIYLARQGAQIGFALDDRMNIGSSVAVKVTYYGTSTGTMTLQYSRNDGFTGSKVHDHAQTNSVKTYTFFLNDFVNNAGKNFQFNTNGSLPIMFVRVIKV